MMENKSDRCQMLVQRLEEVLTQGEWVTGTNFAKAISQVTFGEAVMRIHGLNSIAAITYHVTYYLAGLFRVLDGHPLTLSDAHSFMRSPLAHPAEWEALQQDFSHYAHRCIARVKTLQEPELDASFDDGKYGTIHRNIDVLIEHSYYHLGQVIMIKKMLQTVH